MTSHMGDAIQAWAEASRARTEVQLVKLEILREKRSETSSSGNTASGYSMAKCVSALNDIADISADIYMKAMDKFVDPTLREMFMSMPLNMKKIWNKERLIIVMVLGGNLEILLKEVATVKSGYKHAMIDTWRQFEMGLDIDADATSKFWKRLWKLPLLSRYKVFLWRVCWGVIPTVEALEHRGMEIIEECPMCNLETESVFHALGAFMGPVHAPNDVVLLGARAVRRGLELALKIGCTHILVEGDASLVIEMLKTPCTQVSALNVVCKDILSFSEKF
ncbi:L10-interacting MYB domain-containing protein [Senna tora]|uniref:L10-interacting MYB domain-containing protein n=1 Tax=Senna tora TaxID=362788 RepID=A0A834WYA5_9FABA|nr:L10-interacting MYB domain-containing protein [Senna tora]